MAGCRLGTLELGKEADLALLLQDIFSVARKETGKTIPQDANWQRKAQVERSPLPGTSTARKS
jgi:predicted amidohydrolase YtcJ